MISVNICNLNIIHMPPQGNFVLFASKVALYVFKFLFLKYIFLIQYKKYAMVGYYNYFFIID
uniref:Uncharacterized protein n=1 Tax=viral metagenome TaxID=1070528 RepID=A0A6C0ADM4_9ZZZZ